MTPTTPCGTRRARLTHSGALGSTTPRAWVSMAAASWKWPTTEVSSNMALGRMPPVSRTIQSASKSMFCSTTAAARRNTAARCAKGRATHSFWLALAAAAALRTSCGLARPTDRQGLPGGRFHHFQHAALQGGPAAIKPFGFPSRPFAELHYSPPAFLAWFVGVHHYLPQIDLRPALNYRSGLF